MLVKVQHQLEKQRNSIVYKYVETDYTIWLGTWTGA